MAADYEGFICGNEFGTFFLGYSCIFLASKFLHFFLKFLGQPRVISENIVGMLIGNTHLFRTMDGRAGRMTRVMLEYVTITHFFVLGLEMEPRNLFQRPSRDAVIAYGGMAGTYILVILFSGALTKGVNPTDKAKFLISFAITVASTSSVVVTRLITDLKICKSDFGRLAISSAVHADMVSMIILCIFLGVQKNSSSGLVEKMDLSVLIIRTVTTFIILAVETFMILKVANKILERINEKTSEGKSISRKYSIIILAIAIAVSCLTPFTGYNANVNAFFIGLLLPRQGKLSRMLIRDINIWLNEFMFPLFYASLGPNLAFNTMKKESYQSLVFLCTLSLIGKVSGTVASAINMGFALPEAICLGLLLDVKGHFHIIASVNSLEVGVVKKDGLVLTVLFSLVTIVYIPLVVLVVVWRARKLQAKQQLALQWPKPEAELRLMMCLQGPHNVPGAIKLVESMRGGIPSPKIILYTIDLVELTQRAAASLTYGGEGIDAVQVADESIMEMREEITAAFDNYLEECGERITLRRLLAVSNYGNMHQDICNASMDSRCALIIIPFHKQQRIDGTLDEGNASFRAVNKKVLQNAACSVGIFVDRGLGNPMDVSSSTGLFHVAVLFVNGPDDREALCFAAYIARNPGVQLTAIRLVTTEKPDSRHAVNYKRMPHELRLDEECFSHFFQDNVVNGPVQYMERCVSSVPETLHLLSDLEGHFNLFIVGRRGHRSSNLTAGMCGWQDCPELGLLGDNLASSDFSTTASVLIIQQHNPGRENEVEDQLCVKWKS